MLEKLNTELENLKNEYKNEYKKRGNNAMFNIAFTLVFVLSSFFVTRKLNFELVYQQLGMLISASAGITIAILSDYLSFKKLKKIDNKINEKVKQIEILENEPQKDRVIEIAKKRKIKEYKQKKQMEKEKTISFVDSEKYKSSSYVKQKRKTK